MSDLRDLYQEVILDHSKKPRNCGKLENANHKAEGYNPLCGDRFTLYARVDGGLIVDLRFEGSGCAISKASASMMTATLKGKTLEQAQDLFERFHRMVTRCAGCGGCEEAHVDQYALGKLSVFAGVCEFPARVKCASLAWHTLKAALEREEEPVSTE
jgi:nitrogen fixation NifU-like protein